MAEVIDMPAGGLDRRRDRQDSPNGGDSPSHPLPPPPPGPPPRKRDRDDQNPNPRSPSSALPPPPPPPSLPAGSTRPDRYIRDRDRDRDRDNYYRRRTPSPSPSPPPYSHRERRRSPPLRRSPPVRRSSPGYSPPPYYNKRSRREDGGYDRRRGSEDRRYGYEYGGGRGGYGDDRGPVRYNRQSDWPDSGYGGFGDGSGPTQREGLMTYKQFIQVLEDDILPAEAERRYQEYRNEYITTQKRAYFELHKEEEWLKDKYHPTNLVSVIEKRNEQARSTAKDFLLDLQNGTLDIGPGLTALKLEKDESDANSDESDSSGKRRRRGGRLKDNDPASAAPRAPPVSSEPRRIQADIDQAQSLARKLDSEKGIEGNILSSTDLDKSDNKSMGPIVIIRGPSTVKGLEGVELLDALLTYLYRVHGVDYYGMRETNEPKGLRHVRGEGGKGSAAGAGPTSDEWERQLDQYWKERLAGRDLMERLTGTDRIEAAAGEALDPYVRKIRDEKYGWKYGCGAKGCTKLFHAPEFVHKHLKLKHAELVVELTGKVREELYFQNYMNDPNAPGGTPVMQQAAPQDRMRRRPPMANRLRDERGGPPRREFGDRDDDRNNNNKRRANGSPTRGEEEGSEARNPDEPIFDSFGARGLPRGAPFLAEFPPPPILMPVPGAGPLGPFVPAPPDVAMRMMREQGGGPPAAAAAAASSFDANGGPLISGTAGGRKGGGMAGPHTVVPPGSAPLIAIPPSFQHDPRRIRSYRDLDAPEDEVTVIDYRSL